MTSREHLINAAAITFLNFILNFMFCRSFGLYADDWTYLGHVFRLPYTLSSVIHNIVPYADGRPIQYASGALIGSILNRTRSVEGCYIFTFLIMSVGLLFLYVMLTHRFTSFFSLAVTVLFSLSPLCSIRPFLNGEPGFSFAFIFLFAGGIVYTRQRPLLAYLLGALVLLTYELIFPVFACIPILLKPIRTKRDVARFGCHLGICVLLVGLFAIFKEHYGVRTPGALLRSTNGFTIVWQILLTDLRYSVHCLWGIVDLPLWLHKLHYVDAVVWGVLMSIACYAFITRATKPGSRNKVITAGGFRVVFELILVSIGCIAAGYSLMYFALGTNASAPVASFLDRESRFHIASSFGASLLTAAVVGILLEWKPRSILARTSLIAVVSGYFGLLAGFSVSHQIEFGIAADRQRVLVEQLMALHPAMDPRATFVIYRPLPARQDALSIDEEPHGYYFLLKSMFIWPGPIWPPPGPAIRIVHDRDWEKFVSVDAAGNVAWPATVWPSTPEKLGHIWYYEQSTATLTLPGTPLLVNGTNILQHGSEPAAVSLSALRREPFYEDVPVPAMGSGSPEELARAPEPGIPTIHSVNPSSGSGRLQKFAVMLSDSRGPDDLSGVYLMVQASVEPAHSCWVYFDIRAGKLNLAQDSGTVWMNPLSVGSGALSNSQCSVLGAGAAARVQGNRLEVDVPLEFKPDFKGSKKIFVWARTVGNVDSGWRQEGSWINP